MNDDVLAGEYSPANTLDRKEEMALKKAYEAPMLEIEEYFLDASIASNCETQVHNGPAMGKHSQCEDYVDPFPEDRVAAQSVYNVSFYEDTNCDCYTTGSGGSYWTS